jgi:hypothetical protein
MKNIKTFNDLYFSQLSIRLMGENWPAAFSSCPPGLAAHKPMAGPPKGPSDFTRLGQFYPSRRRSPRLARSRPSQHSSIRRPSVCLTRTKPPAPPVTLAHFSFSPAPQRTRRRRRVSSCPRPVMAGVDEGAPPGAQPRQAPPSFLPSFLAPPLLP